MTLRVRAPHPGEGAVVSELWRELWEVHESFGGYETSHEPGAFEEVARRIDEESRVRHGEPLLGRHVHLVAEIDGSVVGQVEGWIERQRAAARAPSTCEVRSLIVSPSARNKGAARALLDALFDHARRAVRGDVLVAAAEVLAKNPARTFYDREGFRPSSHSVRMAARDAANVGELQGVTARLARAEDALAMCVLDTQFFDTRREHGDPRFGPSRAIDATWLATVAEQIRTSGHGTNGPTYFVMTDALGAVRGKGLFGVSTLLSPFARAQRAIVGFTSFDPSVDGRALAAALTTAAGKLALLRGARWVEVVDLPRPRTSSHDAFLATGASPWSTTVIRTLS